MKRRNTIASDLRTSKYRPRVVPDGKRKANERNTKAAKDNEKDVSQALAFDLDYYEDSGC